MKYVVTVAGRTVTVELDGAHVVVDGVRHVAHAAPVAGTPLWRLELDGAASTVAIERTGPGQWQALWRGSTLEVEALDERTRYIRSLAAAAKGPAGAGVLKAPMPGLVVRVPVEPGQAVAAGQGVVVLEAMKMENELKAPAAATVAKVHVQPGQAVEKGQVLVEFGG
jgi:pyruvate carboxylase subunit B